MDILMTIGLVVLGIIFLTGFVRVLFSPYEGFLNLLWEVMLLDWLGDGICWVVESITDIWDND